MQCTARDAPAQSYSIGHYSALLLTWMHQKYLSTLHLCAGENNEFCMASPPKTKVPGLWRRLVLWCPPESTPDPPRGTPPSEVTLSGEEMPACLIEDLLLHIHVWISGEDSLIKHSKKSNSKHLLFWIWGPVWCLQCCTVIKKEKKKKKKTVFTFVVQRMNPPAVSPQCPYKKAIPAHKGSVLYIFCLCNFWS